jgi:hypothetical protein
MEDSFPAKDMLVIKSEQSVKVAFVLFDLQAKDAARSGVGSAETASAYGAVRAMTVR